MTMAVLAAIAGAAIGALVTLLVKHKLDRDVETRGARREFYVELLTQLIAARRVLEHASFAVDDPVPDILSQDRIDAFDARLEMDASSEVRQLADSCFRLLHRFNVSHALGVPVDVDEHGLFQHRFDLVRGQLEEARLLQMRLALGRIHDDYRSALKNVTECIRREVHGAK